MANIAPRAAGGALAMVQALKAGIANVQQTLVKKGGDPYLKLGRDGIWTYGADNVEVEAGSAWAINPMSIMHGWVAWQRGDDADNSGGPAGEIMVPAHMPKPPENELPQIAKPNTTWGQQYSFSLLCVSGEDKGEKTLYKVNSVGGIAEVDRILKAIGIQLEVDPEKCVPIVVLGSDSYMHKKYKKTYTPIMDIREWVPLTDELPDIAAEEEAEQAEPAAAAEPAKPARTRKAAEPAAAAAPVATATDPDEDPEIAEMMEKIARKQAAKTQAAKPIVEAETEAARMKRELREKLAALEAEEAGDADDAPADPAPAAPAAGAPIRRRRAA